MSMARLAALVGRGVQRLATDAVWQGARSFPRRVGDLDARGVVADHGPPRPRCRCSTALRNIFSGPPGAHRRRRSRFGLRKMSAATGATRMLGELARLGETEARFYKQLAPELDSGVPRCYGSEWDSLTGRYVIVLEDMTLTQCEFPDTLNPLDNDKMALLVEVLAHLHGTFWGRLPETPSGEGQFGWLSPPSADPSVPLTPHLMRLSARRLADRTPIPVDAGRFIWENFQAATAVVDEGPHTVLHGDSHPGNTFFRDDRAGLLDWQVVRRGHPARDLAYTLVHGMTTDDRRAIQARPIDRLPTGVGGERRSRARPRRAVDPLPASCRLRLRLTTHDGRPRRHANRRDLPRRRITTGSRRTGRPRNRASRSGGAVTVRCRPRAGARARPRGEAGRGIGRHRRWRPGNATPRRGSPSRLRQRCWVRAGAVAIARA